MSSAEKPSICFRVDPANPGQFFACCGLLELADRLWAGAEGWFSESNFCIKAEQHVASLPDLLNAAKTIQIAKSEAGSDHDESDDDSDAVEDETSSLVVTSPVSLRLDWWSDKSLKTWAGSMNAGRIFLAMCSAIDPKNDDPLNQGLVVFDNDIPTISTGRKPRVTQPKKREPFYFDARRGASARPIDVGFSPDSLTLTTLAYPVVESMCLVGLQRCRPRLTSEPRVFDYFTWGTPLPVTVVTAAISGLLGTGHSFRFWNAFRTDQKKHKAFNPATALARS